jgi:hypothetical protein
VIEARAFLVDYLTDGPLARQLAPAEGRMKVQLVLSLAFLAFATVAATAETQEEQQACMDDAFNVCGDAIPDRDRVAACLARNISNISAACRTVMLSYQRQEPDLGQQIEPDAATVASCARRFRSYDPTSQTYLGFDGHRHRCP